MQIIAADREATPAVAKAPDSRRSLVIVHVLGVALASIVHKEKPCPRDD
jgi:hypothetical protein